MKMPFFFGQINRNLRTLRIGNCHSFLLSAAKITIICLSAYLIFLYWFNWRWGYTSDHVLTGLMAKSVLERGDRPIYVWTFGYQGILLEVYAIAFLFKCFGTSPIVLYAFSVFCFSLLLFVYRRFVASIYGQCAAWVGMFLVACSSPYFYRYVMRPQPNYTESMLFGIGLMLAIQVLTKRYYVERKPFEYKDYPVFFLLGFLIGFGLYTYIMIVFFLLPILMYLTCIYGRGLVIRCLKRPGSRTVWTICTLLSCVGFIYFVHCYFTAKLSPEHYIPQVPRWHTYSVGLFLPALLYILIDIVCICRNNLFKFIVPATLVIFGFLSGYAPQLYFKYIQHGTSTAKTGINYSPWLFWSNLDKLEAGVRLFFNANTSFLGKLCLYLVAFVTCCHLLCSFVSLLQFISGKSRPDKILRISPIVFLPFVVVILFGLSVAIVDVESSRYALPAYLYAATACSWFFHINWENRHLVRKCCCAFILIVITTSNWTHLTTKIKEQKHKKFPGESAIEALTQRGIQYGVSWFWYAYTISFYTDEKIILQPIDSGYNPYYWPEVRAQNRIAFIHPDPVMLKSLSNSISINDQSYLRVDAWYGDGIGFLVLEKEP